MKIPTATVDDDIDKPTDMRTEPLLVHVQRRADVDDMRVLYVFATHVRHCLLCTVSVMAWYYVPHHIRTKCTRVRYIQQFESVVIIIK